MDVVHWNLDGLKITECALYPSPMGDNAHSMLAHGNLNGEEVVINFPRRLRTFNIKDVAELICNEASKINRRDLAEALLCKMFGDNIGKCAVVDSGYFKKLANSPL